MLRPLLFSDTYMFFAAVFGRLSPSLSLLSYHASRKATDTLYFPASGVLLGPTCFGTCCWAEVPAEFLPGSPGDNSSLFVTASKTECLNLTMTEVVKRQNSKSKKSFNQVTQIMVLLHLVTGSSDGREAGQEEEFEICGAVSNSLGNPVCVGHRPQLWGSLLSFPAQG